MECKEYDLALIQAVFDFGDLEGNIKKADRMVRSAAAQGAKLIVLPESFNRGYSGENINKLVEWSETLGGPTVAAMSNLAKELEVFLVVPLFIRASENCCENTAVLLSDNGDIIGTYAKSHLVPGNEKDLLSPGGRYPVFNTKYGKIGFIICNDLCYPEAARLLGIQGVEIIINPAAWRYFKEWDKWFELWSRSRALDNKAVLASVNRVGYSDGRWFSGGSIVASPDGLVMAVSDFPVEEIVIAHVSLEHIRAKKQASATLIQDRRVEDYGPLSQKLNSQQD